jgi:phosphonate degradation associated HDIG domain protein
MTPLATIETLFRLHGHTCYAGAREEPVTALDHALQCAHLAEQAGAEPVLVAAALLHDLGHFMDGEVPDDLDDDAHEYRALPLLMRAFGPWVAEPVRLHVAAKRYLVASEPDYAGTLSAASIHSLGLQGGPMSARERQAFDAEPFSRAALALRRWDDQAKQPGVRTPPLSHYLALLALLCPLGDAPAALTAMPTPLTLAVPGTAAHAAGTPLVLAA